MQVTQGSQGEGEGEKCGGLGAKESVEGQKVVGDTMSDVRFVLFYFLITRGCPPEGGHVGIEDSRFPLFFFACVFLERLYAVTPLYVRVYTCPPLYLSVLLAYWKSLYLVATLLSRVPACQTAPRIITRSAGAAATWGASGSCAVPPLASGSVLCGREEGARWLAVGSSDDRQSEAWVKRVALWS